MNTFDLKTCTAGRRLLEGIPQIARVQLRILSESMSSSSPLSRVEVHFSGHVQGVGFRYSVMQVARGYEVSGVAENLADGRVRLVAEGDRAEVEAFIEEIGERMHGYIRKAERTDLAGPRVHQGFSMR